MNKLYLTQWGKNNNRVISVGFAMREEQIKNIDAKLRLISDQHLYTEDNEVYYIAHSLKYNNGLELIKTFINEYPIYIFEIEQLNNEPVKIWWAMDMYNMDFDIFDEQAVLNNFDGNKELLKYNIL